MDSSALAFASLAYVDLSGGSASESGLGAAGLSIDIAGQQTLYTTLGTRLAKRSASQEKPKVNWLNRLRGSK